MNDISNINPDIIASIVLNGDISKLTSIQRVQYYNSLCTSLGLDPLTQPFSIIKLQGKEVLYANKNCTQQLSKVYKISHEVTKTEKIEDVYAVTVRAKSGDRFTDEIGAVTIASLKGDALANALMKASTKAKRRAVLAFCGLGMLDETELETIKGVIDVPLEQENAQKAPEIANKQPSSEPLDVSKMKINSEQGQALLVMLKNNGYSKKDLEEFILFEFDLTKLGEITNGHLIKINENFSKPKAKVGA